MLHFILCFYLSLFLYSFKLMIKDTLLLLLLTLSGCFQGFQLLSAFKQASLSSAFRRYNMHRILLFGGAVLPGLALIVCSRLHADPSHEALVNCAWCCACLYISCVAAILLIYRCGVFSKKNDRKDTKEQALINYSLVALITVSLVLPFRFHIELWIQGHSGIGLSLIDHEVWLSVIIMILAGYAVIEIPGPVFITKADQINQILSGLFLAVAGIFLGYELTALGSMAITSEPSSMIRLIIESMITFLIFSCLYLTVRAENKQEIV